MCENFEYSNMIQMKYALKEWSTTIEALGKGKVIAIWRKDGIEGKEFNIEQKQFVLFPAGTHQALDKVKPELWSLSEEKTFPNRDNQVKIKYWAEVEEVLEVKTLEALLRISNELINTNEHLASSWDLFPEHKGKVLLLRVYKLTNPILVPFSQDYAGCKSWIELKIDIPKIGSIPILSFKEYNLKARLIKALIEQPIIPEKLLA